MTTPCGRSLFFALLATLAASGLALNAQAQFDWKNPKYDANTNWCAAYDAPRGRILMTGQYSKHAEYDLLIKKILTRLGVGNQYNGIRRWNQFGDTGVGAAGSGGLIRTQNNGATFTVKPYAEFLNTSLYTGTETYGGTGSGDIPVTDDLGDSWAVEFNVGSHLNGFYFAQNGNGSPKAETIYALADGGLLARKSGGIWAMITTGTAENLYGGVAVSGVPKGKKQAPHFLVGAAGTILRSDSDGQTWVPVVSGVSDDLNSVCFGDTDNGIIVGANGVALVTSNGGVNWTPGNTSVNLDLFDVVHVSAQTAYAVGLYGAFLETVDGGNTWNDLNPGSRAQLEEVHFPTSVVGYAVGAGGTILKSNDEGESWNELVSGTTNRLNGVWFTDDQHGVVAGDSGTLLATSDGGANWDPKDTFTVGALFDVHFPNANVGYVAGLAIAFKSMDGGLTWNQILSFPNTYLAIGTHFLDAQTGFVVGLDGLIAKTTNGGDSWDLKDPAGATGQLSSVWFPLPNVGFVAGDGFILKSVDGGDTWAPTTLPKQFQFPPFFVDIHFPVPTVGFAVGTAFDFNSPLFTTLLRTTDGGTTWEELNESSNSANAPLGVWFSDDLLGHVVGVGGSILKTSNGGGDGATPNHALPPRARTIALHVPYPNPFNPNSTIHFELFKPGTVQLSVFDRAGRLVRRLVSEHRGIGLHRVGWDGTDDAGRRVASGVYVVRMAAGGISESQRIVLLK